MATEIERGLESRIEALEQSVIRADAIRLHPKTVTETVRTCFILIAFQLTRIASIKSLIDVPFELVEAEEKAFQATMNLLIDQLDKIIPND